MGILDSYAPAERSFARRVVIDLAVKRLNCVYSRLDAHAVVFPSRGISNAALREAAADLLVAEELLNDAVTSQEQFGWPWDTNDFHEFWSRGGDCDALLSMMEYMTRMPDWYRLIAEAEGMPNEYRQALLNAIPGWRV